MAYESRSSIGMIIPPDGPPRGYTAKTFYSIPIDIQEHVPAGQLLFFTSDFLHNPIYYQVDNRTRRQRLIDWLKRSFKESWDV